MQACFFKNLTQVIGLRKISCYMDQSKKTETWKPIKDNGKISYRRHKEKKKKSLITNNINT